MKDTLILIECNDQVGLVALIAQVLASHQLNITAMREFVDQSAGRFFARIECLGPGADEQRLEQELFRTLPSAISIRVNPPKKKRIVLLVTKEHHCLADILVRNYFSTLGAEVLAVIGNYPELGAFTGNFGIRYHHVSHQNKDRELFEQELAEFLDAYAADYIVLAKFMRILSPAMVARYSGRLINIHHSFLPAFIGANPYRQAFERGVKLIGATAHYVTNDLDEGPIIVQQTIPVNHTFGVTDKVRAGKEIEKAVLARAMQLLFEDRVFVSGNKTIVFE